MLQTKGLELSTGSKSKNASKMLALQGEDAIVSRDYYMPGVTVCQEKMRPRIHGRFGDGILAWVVVSSEPTRKTGVCGTRPSSSNLRRSYAGRTDVLVESQPSMTRDAEKFINFVHAFGAARVLLRKAHKDGALLEGLALYASLTDAFLRLALVLKSKRPAVAS